MTAPCQKLSVALGPVRDQDWDLLAQGASSKAWLHASGSRQYFSPAQFRKIVEGNRDEFLMVHTREGRPAGAVSWRTGQYPASFEIGAMVGNTELWGSGFGMESIIAVVRQLSDTQHAHPVEFVCGVFNRAMVQFYCSGIVKIEGVLRNFDYLDGAYTMRSSGPYCEPNTTPCSDQSRPFRIRRRRRRAAFSASTCRTTRSRCERSDGDVGRGRRGAAE